MFDSYFEKKFSAFNIFHFPNFEISVSLHLTGTRNTVIIVLTAMVNALYICSLAMSANCNMQVRLPMNNNKDNKKITLGKHASNGAKKYATTLI